MDTFSPTDETLCIDCTGISLDQEDPPHQKVPTEERADPEDHEISWGIEKNFLET